MYECITLSILVRSAYLSCLLLEGELVGGDFVEVKQGIIDIVSISHWKD